MKYTLEINIKNKEIWIQGVTKNKNDFNFLIVKENNLIKYVGNKPIDLYRKGCFTGGELVYFEKQLESFKYILN